MYARLAALGLLAGTAHAHNWQTSPETRNGNKAATALPCPPAKDGYTPFVASAGVAFNVVWTTNHNAMHWMKAVPLAKEAELENLAKDSAELVHYSEYPTATASGSVTFDDVGTYVLQYGWQGYRNCMTVDVQEAPDVAPTPTPTLPQGPGEDAFANLNCNSYCTDILENCGGMFANRAACMETCATFSQDGTPGDATGNTLQCRWYHLHVEPGNMETHCSHASPGGGGEGHCVGGDYIPGVALTVWVDPQVTAFLPSQLVTQLETALVEAGYDENAFTVSEPSLDAAATYSLIINFYETPDDDQPMAQAMKLKSNPTPVTSQLVGNVIQSAQVNVAPPSEGGSNGGAIAAGVIITLLVVGGIAGGVFAYKKYPEKFTPMKEKFNAIKAKMGGSDEATAAPV